MSAKALAAFTQGQSEAAHGDTAAAARDLATAARWEPARDAATAALVQLWVRQNDPQRTLDSAGRYPLAKDDPFTAAIGKPAARAAVQLQQWKAALAWTARFPSDPEMLWLRAQAHASLGQQRNAALNERTLVYRFPASPYADQARPAWQRHERALPHLAADWKLTAQQAAAWEQAGLYQKAAEAWTLAEQKAPRSQRPALEANETRAWLHAGHLITTRTRLRSLLRGPERAQALELEVELARHRSQPDEIPAPLAALAKKFPHSRWYARALHEAGNEAVLRFDDAAAQAHFGRLSRSFPHSEWAAQALWRADWIAFRLQQKDTPARLDHYLRTYPHGPAAVDALYWRGVWAQQHHDPSLAQQCFQAAAHRFPGTFFGQQAADRLASASAAAAAPVPSWLRAFRKPAPDPATPLTPARFHNDVQRAGWLQQAGILDAAAVILSHALYATPASHSLALARQVGSLDQQRHAWNQAMAAVIRAVPHYMELQPDQLRPTDWQLLFPAPYQDEIVTAAEHFGLNKYLVLGLIRQESGFNPDAVSSASARGLMQLELGTARAGLPLLPAKWRKLKGPGRLSAADLLKPELNVALGAAELQRLLGQYNEPAYALAGYNAGSRRVQQWQNQFPGLPLDAFIESVPFSQTRDYIQAVLRNARHYREIYGPDTGSTS